MLNANGANGLMPLELLLLRWYEEAAGRGVARAWWWLEGDDAATAAAAEPSEGDEPALSSENEGKGDAMPAAAARPAAVPAPGPPLAEEELEEEGAGENISAPIVKEREKDDEVGDEGEAVRAPRGPGNSDIEEEDPEGEGPTADAARTSAREGNAP